MPAVWTWAHPRAGRELGSVQGSLAVGPLETLPVHLVTAHLALMQACTLGASCS